MDRARATSTSAKKAISQDSVVCRDRPTETVRRRTPQHPFDTQRNTVLRSGGFGSMAGTLSSGISSAVRAAVGVSALSTPSRKRLP